MKLTLQKALDIIQYNVPQARNRIRQFVKHCNEEGNYLGIARVEMTDILFLLQTWHGKEAKRIKCYLRKLNNVSQMINAIEKLRRKEKITWQDVEEDHHSV